MEKNHFLGLEKILELRKTLGNKGIVWKKFEGEKNLRVRKNPIAPLFRQETL